jgi:hypothetical protein
MREAGVAPPEMAPDVIVLSLAALLLPTVHGGAAVSGGGDGGAR